jgi:glycosyltransferase involved in cell wall biosynthesis
MSQADSTYAGTIALYYDDSAYVETVAPPDQRVGEVPLGLMGRQVAGKEFLDAYLTHGAWSQLVVLARNQASNQSFMQLFRAHPAGQDPKRSVRLFDEQKFHAAFFPQPAARLLHFPSPLSARHAWARQHSGRATFAFCGVTHTLCGLAPMDALCQLVTAPFESCDALICTSQAVVDTVRAVAGAYADYLRDRHGGTPRIRVRLERIPLGVNTDRYRPPTPAERTAQRQALHIADDELAVLFVGRLSFHAKAHPFPIFHGLAQAARNTGRKVHLILAGWAASPDILNAFVEGVREFAPGVRVTIIDASRPPTRFGVWHAADLFTSLVDNIQETFGLSIIEAMASGLPVVASDWNGYRDLVVPDQTGYLIPTVMVPGATASLTSRLLVEEIDYDNFLAASTQTVAVDCQAAAQAYARLLKDEPLRRQMGAAGRQHVLDHFAWPRIIRAYEELWQSQQEELASGGSHALSDDPALPNRRTPACYPEFECSFPFYPTLWLQDGDLVQAVPGAESRLERFRCVLLTSYAADGRVSDVGILRSLLAAAAGPCPLTNLERLLRNVGVTNEMGRATLAWMLKYDLLRTGPASELS